MYVYLVLEGDAGAPGAIHSAHTTRRGARRTALRLVHEYVGGDHPDMAKDRHADFWSDTDFFVQVDSLPVTPMYRRGKGGE